MIIKGRSRADGGALANYLLTEHDRQQARVIDLRDTASPELNEAFTDWETTAKALTKGKQSLYHAQIRLAPGEHLTREQWMHTIGKLETRLGLDNCPRAVVGHTLDGELHLHVVWSRLDLDKEKLVHMGYDSKKHHAIAREAEKAFGLRQLGKHRAQLREQTAERERSGTSRQRDREYAQAKRGGTTRPTLEKLVAAAFTAADSPAAFDANLKRLGITLAQGERRDYIITHKGQTYNPVRFIPGMTAAKMREKMKGYEPEGKTKERSGEREPIRRRAEQRQADYLAAKLPANDNAAPSEPKRKPTKRPPAPRMRPRLYYGDPGI